MLSTAAIVPHADQAVSAAAEARHVLDGYIRFRAIIDAYQEPERPSWGYVAAHAASVAEKIDVPAAQLHYDADGLAGLEEGRTFRLGISPGIISCRSTDYSATERTKSAASAKRSMKVDMDVNPYLVDGLYSRVSWETGEIFDDDTEAGARAEITGWSAKSRVNMSKTLASLDYSTWPQADGALAMVTLTLPARWQEVAPDGKAFKQAVERFRRRWTRAVKTPWRLLWKLEFQRRGAPHWHALMRVPAVVNGKRFEDWLSVAWADSVAASKVIDRPDGSSEYTRHVAAGTGVDFSGQDFSDPRRIAMYFLGHSAKTQDGKEYQHIVPEEWRAPGKGPGRFWGFCGLDRALVELEVTQRDYDRLRREMRKLARARAWETAVKRDRGASPVWQVKGRKLRRSQLGGGGGQNGGWVLLNDALAVVHGLSDWLATPNHGSWDGLVQPSVLGARKRATTSDAAARFIWDQAFQRLAG